MQLVYEDCCVLLTNIQEYRVLFSVAFLVFLSIALRRFLEIDLTRQ